MRKILQVKKGKKQGKRTRIGPKKAKPGAFWVLEGMGTVGNRCERIEKTGKLGGNRGTDLSRLPPRVLLPSGERPAPTEAGAETGAWTQPTGLQAPTTRTAQGAAVPRCQILPHTNEKVRHRRSDT